MRARADSSRPAFGSVAAAIGWAVAAALLALHAWMLHRYAVDFPLQDDYTQLLPVPSVFDVAPTWRDKIAYVFSLSTDHRIATLRVTALVQAKLLGGLDFGALVWFGNALCLVAALLVISRADARQRAWAAALLAGLVLSPANFVSQYWATGALAHFSVAAYAFGALFCVLRRGAAWMTAAALLAVASAFTVANGIMVFPVAAAALAIAGRRREALAWLVATVALFGWYFAGHAEAGGQQGTIDLVRQPFRLAALWMAVLGSIAGRFDAAVAIGALIVAAWSAFAFVPQRRAMPREFVVWIAFVVLSAAAIAAGRAAFGAEAMLNSRYRLYSQLACAITLLALSTKLPARWSALPPAVALPVALWWFVHAWQQTMPHIVDLWLRLQTGLAHYALVGDGIWNDFPKEEFGRLVLLRAAAAGDFAPGAPSAMASALVETDARAPPESPVYNFWTLPPYVDSRSVTVGGFGAPSDQQVSLWLASGDRRYAAQLATRRMFWKFERSADLTTFWGSCPLAGLAPGRYRIGYAFAADGVARMTWTNDWVQID